MIREGSKLFYHLKKSSLLLFQYDSTLTKRTGHRSLTGNEYCFVSKNIPVVLLEDVPWLRRKPSENKFVREGVIIGCYKGEVIHVPRSTARYHLFPHNLAVSALQWENLFEYSRGMELTDKDKEGSTEITTFSKSKSISSPLHLFLKILETTVIHFCVDVQEFEDDDNLVTNLDKNNGDDVFSFGNGRSEEKEKEKEKEKENLLIENITLGMFLDKITEVHDIDLLPSYVDFPSEGITHTGQYDIRVSFDGTYIVKLFVKSLTEQRLAEKLKDELKKSKELKQTIFEVDMNETYKLNEEDEVYK